MSDLHDLELADTIEAARYRRRPRHRATGSFRCPTHGQRVNLAADGSLLGRCAGCTAEAARAIKVINWNRTTTSGRRLDLDGTNAGARQGG